MPDSKASKAADLKRFLQILPYGDEGVFGFGGWRWSTPHPDESVGSVKLVDDLIIKEPVVEVPRTKTPTLVSAPPAGGLASAETTVGRVSPTT
mmetsp:Transcript_4226/g.7723  ORF Transcript_4226/g.7723 Transcript_4226/m.7723 type:complete len:93 (+) Transcript_4226:196-474(+)